MNKATIWQKPATWKRSTGTRACPVIPRSERRMALIPIRVRSAAWAFWLCAFLLVLVTACVRQTSTAEDTAIRFYKAVWVDGDMQKARSVTTPSVKVRELAWRIEETRRNRPVNSPILIVESPLHASMNPARKVYLIRRPRDLRDFQVELSRKDGRWIVTGFKQNYHRLRGGYNSGETFERLQHEHPGLKWRHIEQP